MRLLEINKTFLIVWVLNVKSGFIFSENLGGNYSFDSFGLQNHSSDYMNGIADIGTKEGGSSSTTNDDNASTKNDGFSMETSIDSSPGEVPIQETEKKSDSETKPSEKQESAAMESTYVDDDETSGDYSSEGDSSENDMESKKDQKEKGEKSDTKYETHSEKSQDPSREETASLERDISIEKSLEEQSIVPNVENDIEETSESLEPKEREKNVEGINNENLQDKNEEFQKASTSIEGGVPGSAVGSVVPSTLDLLLGVVQPTRSFSRETNRKPLDIEFGRKNLKSTESELDEIRTKLKGKYIPTPSCDDIINKFEWNKDLIGTASQAAFKTIFKEITSLKHMTNIQAEKTINAAFDVLKDPVSEGINPQEALALYVCEGDKLNGRTIYQKLIEYGYLSSLLHPIANKMWGCVKFGHYYDSSGNNPLHLAAKSNSLQVVDFVLRLIKDPIEIKLALEEKNALGQTPLDISIDEKRPSIIRRFKTTYRTMSNYVKRLNPEAVIEERNKQKIMTETAAMFCKPVLSYTSSEEDAAKIATENSDKLNQRIRDYTNEILKDNLVRKNLRLKKEEYNEAKDTILSEKSHRPIRAHNRVLDISENVLDYIPNQYEDKVDYQLHDVGDENELNKSQVQTEVIEGSSDDSSLESQYIARDKDEIRKDSKTNSEDGNEISNEDKPEKSKNFLEKVLFWSIIVFCIVFTVVLLLIWFATKV